MFNFTEIPYKISLVLYRASMIWSTTWQTLHCRKSTWVNVSLKCGLTLRLQWWSESAVNQSYTIAIFSSAFLKNLHLPRMFWKWLDFLLVIKGLFVSEFIPRWHCQLLYSSFSLSFSLSSHFCRVVLEIRHRFSWRWHLICVEIARSL